MKRTAGNKGAVISLLCGAGLLCVGMAMIYDVFRDCEWAVFFYEDHHQLIDVIRRYAYTLMLGMGMVTGALGVILVAVLHMLRSTARIQKEVEALQLKNKQMQELNKQVLQLNHHQRLELMGTLTSSIAHEFNNLLTPIMGYSLMALEKLPPEEELYDNLLEVYNASREAKNLISRLNDLSRKQSETSFHMVSLDEVVSRALRVAAPAKPKTVEVQQNLNCWGQRIRINEIQISQLVLNLVLNGFQAIEGAGKLTVETSFDERWAYIRVTDTGCGIPEEIKSRIFEPFFTTKETGKGTGLGLAIASQTVEDHRGKISLDSKVGEGTSFTVWLPRE